MLNWLPNNSNKTEYHSLHSQELYDFYNLEQTGKLVVVSESPQFDLVTFHSPKNCMSTVESIILSRRQSSWWFVKARNLTLY
jgi:hypothetical protein